MIACPTTPLLAILACAIALGGQTEGGRAIGGAIDSLLPAPTPAKPKPRVPMLRALPPAGTAVPGDYFVFEFYEEYYPMGEA